MENLKFSLFFNLFYVHGCTHMTIYFCVPGTHGNQKRALDPLKLKLQIVADSNMGAEN